MGIQQGGLLHLGNSPRFVPETPSSRPSVFSRRRNTRSRLHNMFTTFHFLLLIWMANCDNFSLLSKARVVTTIAGNVGQLPCQTGPIEEVAMILWFKDSSGSPIYSYDARYGDDPTHSTINNDWGLRLYFRVWPSLRRSPALIIRDIRAIDGGLYRCRVDYKNAPTKNFLVQLNVIEPPSRIEIQDVSQNSPSRLPSDQQTSNQHSDITYLGPYNEGQNVTIVCNVFEGNPPPNIQWLKNGKLLNMNLYSHYTSTGKNVTTSKLLITSVGKEQIFSTYTCQANNNNETTGITHTVNLDVYLGVKEVELDLPDEMTAGAEYNVICRSTGAYPTVKMEIWKMQKRLGPKYQIRSDADNITTFNFSYKPEILDDESTMSCKAENPWLKQKPVVARKPLKIKYTPVAILRFGQNKTSNFTEGESVLMECHVKANPPIYAITWFRGKEQLHNNETKGIRIRGMTLLLTYLRANYGGKYFCQAANAVGKELSNPLTIELNLPPKCVSMEPVTVQLGMGETHRLACSIIAWPPDLNFYWTLNRSNEIVPILPVAVDNYTHGAIEGIPLEEFDEYIYPQMRPDESNDAAQALQRSQGGNPPPSFPDRLGSSNKTNVDGGKSDASKSTQSLFIGAEKKLFTAEEKLKSLGGRDGPVSFKGQQRAGWKPYGRWNVPQDALDNIHHEAILSYTIKSYRDYGVVSCFSKNSWGKQISPCVFHITEKHQENQDEAFADSQITRQGRRRNGSLTGRLLEDLGADPAKESGTLVPSKLPMTSGIILTVLLIFIAVLAPLLFLLIFSKRRRQIQRMIGQRRSRGKNQQPEIVPLKDPTTTGLESKIVSKAEDSSAAGKCMGKCESTVSSTTGFGSLDDCLEEQQPLALDIGNDHCCMDHSTRLFYRRRSPDNFSSAAPSDALVISGENDFPPPPISIISSQGYGSFGDDADELEEEAEEEELLNPF